MKKIEGIIKPYKLDEVKDALTGSEEAPGAAQITLAAAFSQAGAQSIVASLWKVNDAATRDFMVEFHKDLATRGRAVALQQAELAVLRNPATAHPFYWAPFILIGGR
jgi:CHAT domain-containing protein